jgi:hypothetical protein
MNTFTANLKNPEKFEQVEPVLRRIGFVDSLGAPERENKFFSRCMHS